ncbi:MAG: arsenate reductase ArsC, partial [Ignavibacteria bacterium]
MKKKILIVCTGNSCRSQMAEAFLKKIAPELDIISAGTEPENSLTNSTIEVMKELGFDMSDHYPKDVYDYAGKSFDFVITLSDNAKKTLPKFTGRVSKKIHVGFVDPALAKGTKEAMLNEY